MPDPAAAAPERDARARGRTSRGRRGAARRGAGHRASGAATWRARAGTRRSVTPARVSVDSCRRASPGRWRARRGRVSPSRIGSQTTKQTPGPNGARRLLGAGSRGRGQPLTDPAPLLMLFRRPDLLPGARMGGSRRGTSRLVRGRGGRVARGEGGQVGWSSISRSRKARVTWPGGRGSASRGYCD